MNTTARHTAIGRHTALPADMFAAVYHFLDTTLTRHDGMTFHHDFGGHLHLYLTADHGTRLLATVTPGPDDNPDLAARITVTDTCPTCNPDEHTATDSLATTEHAVTDTDGIDTGRRYTVTQPAQV